MMHRRYNVVNNFSPVIALFLATCSEVWGKHCDGGHFCSPPKECCDQGCCYMFPPTGYHPAMRPGQDLYGIFFYTNWYFWAALCAAFLLCVCTCAWRRNWQCGRAIWSRRPASDRDSAGSCYFPPQYSRCSSFQRAPPPPYMEVTSKPDLYPLVITYGENNDKSGPNYLMVQYFRNYVIRPPGSLSATSTAESLNSSFICNAANETNTIIPPPYSCTGSFDEWRAIPPQRQALLRSVSAVSCHQASTVIATANATTIATPTLRARVPHSATTHFAPLQDTQPNSTPRPSDNGHQTPRHASNGQFSQLQDDVHQNTQHCEQRNNITPDSIPTSHTSKTVSPTYSGRLSGRDSTRVTPSHRRKITNSVDCESELLLCDSQNKNLDNVSIQKVQNNSWTDNFFTKAFEQCNPNRSKHSSNEERRRNFQNRTSQIQGDASNVSSIDNTHPYPNIDIVTLSESHSSRADPSVNSATSNNNFDKDFKRRAFFLSLQEGESCTQRPNSDVTSPEIPGENRADHYTSGSDVSSVFNYTHSQTPPHSGSPARHMYTKAQKQTNSNEVIIPTSHITYSSDTNKSRKIVIRNRKISMYMPLGATSSSKAGKTSPTITSFYSSSRNIPGRRSWLSRSAPTTPCGNGLMPNMVIFSQNKSSVSGSSKLNKEESNPLLNECDENKYDDRAEDQAL